MSTELNSRCSFVGIMIIRNESHKTNSHNHCCIIVICLSTIQICCSKHTKFGCRTKFGTSRSKRIYERATYVPIDTRTDKT